MTLELVSAEIVASFINSSVVGGKSIIFKVSKAGLLIFVLAAAVI